MWSRLSVDLKQCPNMKKFKNQNNYMIVIRYRDIEARLGVII